MGAFVVGLVLYAVRTTYNVDCTFFLIARTAAREGQGAARTPRYVAAGGTKGSQWMRERGAPER
jgi:hypothetical protein